MKKLINYTWLDKGKIYNRVYVGSNDAYARINGKETFLVLKTEPVLAVQVLYDQFGSPYSEDLRGGVVTFTSPKIAFKEFELFEPENESEWFKKSTRVNCLQEAIDRKLIPESLVAHKRINSNGFVPTTSGAGMIGVHWHISVEDKTDQPLLQTVYVVWKNWEELRADFQKFGTKVNL